MLPTVTVKGNVTGILAQVTARVLDCSPAMERIRREVFEPAAESSWVSSGLHELTGELRAASESWSGKRSAGVTLRTSRGRDLVLPKAATHTSGRAKQSRVRKKTIAVKAHGRDGRRVRRHRRINPGSPWGDIPARPFFPDGDVLASNLGRMKTIIEGHLNAAAR